MRPFLPDFTPPARPGSFLRSTLALLAVLLLGLTGLLGAPLAGAAPRPQDAAAVPSSSASAPARPRIALVLSGGGARGLAHIGVLRELQRQHVPVDMVVGTSMGALVGGAFAAGHGVDELEAFVLHTDWAAILADRAPRQDISLRRREDDVLVPSRLDMGLGLHGVTLPPAAAGNSGLEFTLEHLSGGKRAGLQLNALPLPFRAIATDLLSGDLVDMDDVPLFLAMRASMAVPGVFSPVRVKGRLVVDGGLVRNLGIETALAMGADVIIAVNVGTPLADEKSLSSAVGVANQMVNILTTQNVSRSLKALRPQDILIDPDLADMSFMDFTRREEAMETGARATRAAQDRLAALVLPPEAYATHEQKRSLASETRSERLPLATLDIEGQQFTRADTLKAEMGLNPGDEVSRQQIQRATAELYGRGDFDRVDTVVEDRDGQRHVTVQLNEADWSRSRLRLGLELYSNFNDNHRFSLVGLHTFSWLNDWGAELRTLGRIGDKREFSTELYQPLGPGSSWFLLPKLAYQSSQSDYFSDGRRTALLGNDEGAASVSIGRRFGQSGELLLGSYRIHATQTQRLPENPADPPVSVDATAKQLSLHIDTLDNLAFPTRGVLLDANYALVQPLGAVSLMGSPITTTHSAGFTTLAGFRSGLWAGHVYASASYNSGVTGSLGGFLQLSGTPDNSVTGNKLVMGRVVMARRVGELPLGLGGAVRAGFSLEAGGALGDSSDRWSGLKFAGSGFVTMDTRFGPVYLAAGSTYHGSSALYLFLGPVW